MKGCFFRKKGKNKQFLVWKKISKRELNKFLACFIVLITLMCSLGYAALNKELNISGEVAYRVKADIRVTDLRLNGVSEGTIEEYAEFSKDTNIIGVDLPREDSTISYVVQVTNFSDVEMGIFQITGLPDELTYELSDYTLKDKLCSDDGNCKVGAEKEFILTIKYRDNAYKNDKTFYNFILKYDFRVFHKITYTDFEIETSQFPQEVMAGDTFRMTLEKPFPIGAKPFYGSTPVDYKFDGDTLVVENITNNLEVKSNYIQTIEDLVTLSNYVNNGNTYKGITFTLDKNLDFQDEKSYRDAMRIDFGDINGQSGTENLLSELTNENGTGFQSIGNYTYHFQGNFDGNNYTIDNLYIHSYSNGGYPERTVASLFGFITDGEIKNLIIKGNTITDETANIGGITSYASNISLDNVHNYVNITSHGTGYSVGGLIGSVGNDNIGLAGDNIRISNCSNHGTLQGGNHGGGLVGAIGSNSHLFVSGSYNAGRVMNSIITNAGILALNNGNCYINNSYNIGNISSNGKGTGDGVISIGGLMAANYDTVFILNSYNSGTVEYVGTAAKGGSIGGLIGLVQGGGHILNSYNIGTVRDNINRSYVGGIANTVTWNNPVHKQIYNVYNAGTITGGNTRYQIGYQYSGNLKDVFYKSGTGISGSNSSGSTEISDSNMRLDANNSSSLTYKLNNGIKDINLDEIKSDLINHGYNSNYFDLTLNSWVIDSDSLYPTLKLRE